MINEYERRFQRSLQKLIIPTWFNVDQTSTASKHSSRQSIISMTPNNVPTRPPEVNHYHRPRSYRSCRSSIATSPSPSIRSWHPNYLRSTSSSRPHGKYQKGIERVSKSSHWYKPTTFVSTSNNVHQSGAQQNPIDNESLMINHYDIPQRNPPIITNIKQTIVPFPNDHLEKTIVTNEKSRALCSPPRIPSLEMLPLSIRQIEPDWNESSRTDTNSGVRELSDDETGLRELDENDMNDTDEFIVFALDTSANDEHSTSTINRLYTFAKSHDNSNSETCKQPNNSSQNEPLPPDGFLSMDEDLSFIHKSSEGVNEDTARIGRLLLASIPKIADQSPERIEDFPMTSIEYDEDIRHDSGYSSNQERLPMAVSIYEPLYECYSGVPSDFLTTNISSMTDEAYESEPTTMSSSTGTATLPHVHPDLVHEFEYPSPPPPVPDRRLKPAHLRTPLLQRQEKVDSVAYSIIQKQKSSSPLSAIQQFIGSIGNDSSSTCRRTASIRNYCGSIPTTREIPSPSSPSSSHYDRPAKEKRTHHPLSCLHSTAVDDQDRPSHKSKTKKHSRKEYNAVSNGLAIRLPSPLTNGHETSNKSMRNKLSTPTSNKRVNGVTKNRSIVDDCTSIRAPVYETSV